MLSDLGGHSPSSRSRDPPSSATAKRAAPGAEAAWDAGLHPRGAELPFGLGVEWGWQGSRPVDVLLECQGISARVTCSPKMLDGVLWEDLPYCLSLPFLCVTLGKCSHYVNSRITNFIYKIT